MNLIKQLIVLRNYKKEFIPEPQQTTTSEQLSPEVPMNCSTESVCLISDAVPKSREVLLTIH